MNVPEPFKVFATGFFNCSEDHGHEGDEHDVACCTRAGAEVGKEPPFDASIRGDGETGKVYPMGNGVDPCEEDDGPGYEFVQSDVFVEIDDAV